MKNLRYQVWYSEGVGTSRYICAEFETQGECEDYCRRMNSYRARFEIVDTSVKG